ncbi:pilin [Patescibacteria group bacterium]|nr:pilin [Patescibacteria group bacterium]
MIILQRFFLIKPSKVLLFFFFSLVLFFIFSYSAKAAAGDFVQQRCWFEDNCKEGKGLWEKDPSVLPGGCAANPTNISCQNCDEVGGQATARCFAPSPSIPLQVGIPGVSEKFCSSYTLGEEPTSCSTDQDCQQKGLGFCRPGITGGFPGYLAAFYKFFIGFLAVAAVVMIMWGGFKRIAAAGSAETIKNANSTIISAIVGLVIALMSYSLLQLVNPALVKNTLPGIEMVKPEIFGFCPAYQEAKSLYNAGYTYYECVGGSFDRLPCFKDEDCKPAAGETKNGTCVERQGKNSPSSSCGKKLVLSTGECTGLECQETGQGCFKNSSREGFPYACSSYMLKGKLVGIEVNRLDALLICNNGDKVGFDCGMMKPNGTISDTMDVENNGYYTLTGCWSGLTLKNTNHCAAAGGVKGLALLVERESDGCDDWYAIDASTCGTISKKILDNNGIGVTRWHSGYPICALDLLADDIDYTKVSADKLFQPFDSNGKMQPIACDLNITDTEFPDR